LNDFLPHSKNKTFDLEFAPHQTLKHLIESLGVPHTEFGRLLVNGNPGDRSNRLAEGDQVVIYPAQDAMLSEPRFILDNHLGQLATYLRMLGFDSLYRNDFQDDELARLAGDDSRVLLTRDRRLLMRKSITLGYCLHHTDPRKQAVEVLHRFNLLALVKPFKRCLRCNSPLQVVSKEEIYDRLQPLTKIYYEEFHWCPSCKQVYWKGSHFEHMQQMISEMSAQP
jgi:uncharacterized protein with PIN domain